MFDTQKIEALLEQLIEQNNKILILLEMAMHHKKAPPQNAKTYDNQHLIDRINSLSIREHQIVGLLVDGKLNKEIAYELSLSLSTVECHRANIMRKMGAKNVAQLIKIYIQAQTILDEGNK